MELLNSKLSNNAGNYPADQVLGFIVAIKVYMTYILYLLDLNLAGMLV